MNSTSWITFFTGRNLPGLAVLIAAGLPVMAAPVARTNEPPVVPRSVFIQPANPQEGRDPFFPRSTRPYASAVVVAAPTTDLSSLSLQGISGTPDHRLVVINNVTFAVGDEAEVLTSHGRFHIHCLAITNDSAVIEASGQRQTLHYKPWP